MSKINIEGSRTASIILNKIGSAKHLIEVTHSELVALRDSASLIPGVFYRITDYATTTTQDNTRVVENLSLSIIVLALSKNTLADKAYGLETTIDDTTRVVTGYSLYKCIDPDDGNDTWGVILPNDPQVGDVIQGRYKFDADTAVYLDTENRGERHFSQVTAVNGNQVSIAWCSSDNYPYYSDQRGVDTFEYVSSFDGEIEYRSYDYITYKPVDESLQTNGIIFANIPQVGDTIIGRYDYDTGKVMYIGDDPYPRYYTQVSSVNGDTIMMHWMRSVDDEGDDEFVRDYRSSSSTSGGIIEGDVFELTYSLDNINWSAEDGKGTITWMKDKTGNEAPYDFKNIQFKRCQVSDGFPVGYYGIPGVDMVNISSIDEDDYIWCYTFGGENDISGTAYCHNNIITAQKSGRLNNIVMYWTGSSCMHDNVMGDESSDCTIRTTNCRFEETIFGATWVDSTSTYKQIGYGPLGITQLCPDIYGIADLYNPYRGSDVVLYDSELDKHVVVPCGSLIKFPSPRYTPIGIVVIPASHTEIIYPDDSPLKGKDIMMSLKHMNCDTPDTGASSWEGMSWGGLGTDISELQNYTGWGYIASDKFSSFKNSLCPGTGWYSQTDQIPSTFIISSRGALPNEAYYNDTTLPTSDFKGKENTQIICSNITVTDWQTRSSIDNSYEEGNYPAAACCWRYHTPGTSQGDWYLPAAGELGYLAAFFFQHNKAVDAIIDAYGLDSTGENLYAFWLDGGMYWSSSEHGSSRGYALDTNNGCLYYYEKDSDFYVVAFCGVNA